MSKFKLCVFFVLICLIGAVNYVSAGSKSLPLLSKVIYIDPGHGGADSGAYYKGVRESDLNLEISKKIASSLKKEGATVYLTRYGDYDLATPNAYNRKRSDLSRRANVINKSGCDMFISIHLNACEEDSWYGAQVYYDNINSSNEEIASVFSSMFKRYLNTSRDYKENNTKYMQRRINRPGVLLEVGFLSNANERYLLQSREYQEKVALVIKKSILNYYSNH